VQLYIDHFLRKGIGIMNKTALVITAICLLAGWSTAVLVDNFDSYSTGAVGTVTGGSWVTSPAPTVGTPLAESISADPTDAGNKVLNITTNGSAQIGAYGLLAGNEIVTNGTTKTLSLRFYTTATTCDTSFGLTTVDAPNGFANFNVQCFINKGNFGARNGGTATNLMTWTANTWYYVWVVVDNAANTYSVYVKTTPANATSADLKASGYAFRTIGTANPDGDIDRFYAIANYGSGVTGGTQELFDDIHIRDGIALSMPGSGATTPSPTNGMTNVLTTATLSWNTGVDPTNPANPNPNITKHYVSFRKGDPNLAGSATLAEVTATGATGTWTPPTTGSNAMAMDGTYYWRIDESVNDSSRTDPNTIQGAVWSFAAQKSAPVITTDIAPAENRVFADGNASFTVLFTSISTPTVKWYKYVNGTSDTLLSTGGGVPDPNGYYTTLTIATVAEANQGRYYCTVQNLSGSTAIQSGNGVLIVKKLLAEYLFEGNLLDTRVNGAPAGQGKSVAGLTEPNALLASNVTLSFVEGVGGAGTQAVTLDDPNQYVDFGSGAYPKAADFTADAAGGGLDEGTILCWVKPTTSGTILLNYNDGATTGIGISLAANSGTADARIDIRGEGLAAEYQVIGTVQGRPNRPAWNVFDGAWHLIATTWNTGGTLRMYVDGQQVNSVAAGTPAHYLAWQRGVLLGTSRTGANRNLLANFLGGAVDNLRVYNYEIDANAIAQEYVNATGISPCVDSSFVGSAYNFDNTGSSYCKVDFADFAVFAQNWLADGLF
jgi:hypothetical protein